MPVKKDFSAKEFSRVMKKLNNSNYNKDINSSAAISPTTGPSVDDVTGTYTPDYGTHIYTGYYVDQDGTLNDPNTNHYYYESERIKKHIGLGDTYTGFWPVDQRKPMESNDEVSPVLKELINDV